MAFNQNTPDRFFVCRTKTIIWSYLGDDERGDDEDDAQGKEHGRRRWMMGQSVGHGQVEDDVAEVGGQRYYVEQDIAQRQKFVLLLLVLMTELGHNGPPLPIWTGVSPGPPLVVCWCAAAAAVTAVSPSLPPHELFLANTHSNANQDGPSVVRGGMFSRALFICQSGGFLLLRGARARAPESIREIYRYRGILMPPGS